MGHVVASISERTVDSLLKLTYNKTNIVQEITFCFNCKEFCIFMCKWVTGVMSCKLKQPNMTYSYMMHILPNLHY